MDPLSVISGIAGISAAGATLVSSLYTLVQTVRHAPERMREVAKEMASLTCALEHLHEIISDGHHIASKCYLKGIMSVISGIRKTQYEILEMIEKKSILNRMRWINAKSLLAEIQTHKSTVSMQVVILTLGIIQKDATHKMKSSQRRLRKQAECLVQECQDHLDNRDKQMSRESRLPPPPPAPVPPDSKLQSPPCASDSQTWPWTTAGTRNEHAKPPASHVGEPTHSSRVTHNALPLPSSAPEREEKRKHTITAFDRNLHLDAAALLYDLVFAEASQRGSGKTNGTQNGSKEEAQEDSVGSNGTEFGDFTWNDEDSMSNNNEAGDVVRRQYRVAERRARREQAEQEPGGQANQAIPQPGRVVKHLLVRWTSVDSKELESGEEAPPNDSNEIDEEDIRGKVQALIAQQASAPHEQMYSGDSVSEGDDELSARHRRGNQEPQAGGSGASRIPLRPRPNAAHGPPLRAPYRERGEPSYSQGGFQQTKPEFHQHTHDYRNDSSHFHPSSAGGHYAPYFGQPTFYGPPNSYRNDNPSVPTGYKYYRPPPPPPTESSTDSISPPPSPPPSKEKPVRRKFDKPTILVLRPAYELNEGKDVSAPRLDALEHGLRLSCQSSGDEADMIWNADAFVKRCGLGGTAILGALVNDRSAVRGTDMLDTFVKGHRLPMIYVRGSDLGETWFFDVKPVFVLFYHAAYKPQFFPARAIGGDEDAMRREYVAVGEEWVRQEALDQLGIVPRERRDGRLILEPSITHAEIEVLVRTSYALVWQQQRRKYAGTFYTPLATFRSTHDALAPSPPPAAVPGPAKDGGSTSALDGTSPVFSGSVWETSRPPPPPPTIHIEEVATPPPTTTTTATTPTLVEPESSTPEDRLGHASREQSPSRSSRERGARREGSEGREGGERPEERSRHPYERHRHHHRHHHHDAPRERAPSGGSRHLDARSSYESASVRSGEGGDDESWERHRRRRRRARTDGERGEDKEDRRSQGGSDSGFASLFSFAKGGLRK